MLSIRSFNKNINKCNIFMDTLVSKLEILVLTFFIFNKDKKKVREGSQKVLNIIII